jgi:short-chain Z-isoprenyl diphosphate synthase
LWLSAKLLSSIRNLIKSALYPIYERRIVSRLDFFQTPHHVGVILDGNRRFAKENPDPLDPKGHKRGADKIIDFLGWCEEAQVKVVTLWLLSTDNFKRTPEELDALLKVIGQTVDELDATNRWSVKAVGALDLLPAWLSEKLSALEIKNSKIARTGSLEVNVAIGYGGRREIVDAVKSYILEAEKSGASLRETAEALTDEQVSKFLYTAGQPDPELLIRTSGEQRLGGFLLWQSALSEFYFCEAYWPDFRRVDFLRALRAYAARNRRLGK